MKSDHHPLEALAMDLSGGSLKIAGTAYPLGRITFDPGNRLPGDRPARLVTLHAAEVQPAPCQGSVQNFAGTPPGSTGLLATGSDGDIQLAGINYVGPDHWHASVIHKRHPRAVIGCGKNPAEATAKAATFLKRVTS